MYSFVERLGPEDVEAIAAWAFAEMLESGFTRVVEFHYLHHAPDGSPYQQLAELALRTAAAADESGIGLTLLPVLYSYGNFGGRAAGGAQRRFMNDIERYARLLVASVRRCASWRARWWAWHRTACAPWRPRIWTRSRNWPATVRSTSISPNRCAK